MEIEKFHRIVVRFDDKDDLFLARNYYLDVADMVEIEVDKLEITSTSIEASGFARRKDCTPGKTRRKVLIDTEALPRPVLNALFDQVVFG